MLRDYLTKRKTFRKTVKAAVKEEVKSRVTAARAQELFEKNAEQLRKNDYIESELYVKNNVKRGLRNSNGTGVLVGLTKIGEVIGYDVDEKKNKIPVEGKLYYRGYEQWGRECKELPSFIIKRLPLRYTYDNNYFKDPYQGIPKGGYTRIIKKLLEGVQVCLKTDFFANREELTAQADKILFTGMIDEFYDYCYGELEYRSLRFETEVLDMGNYQGNAVVNYTDYEVPYTRIIEHKHFEFGTQPKTVITREYPAAWEKGKEPYYPINDPKNDELFDKYERRALEEKNVLFGGRLGMYRYMDMDKVIEEALNMAETELTYEEV